MQFFWERFKEWEELSETKVQKKSGGFSPENFGLKRFSFSHYPCELILRLQGDVREAELCGMGWRMADQAGLCFADGEIAAEVIGGDECEGAVVRYTKEENRSRGKDCPRECYKKKEHSLPKDM